MKKRTRCSRFYIILFIVCMCLPWFLWKGIVHGSVNMADSENRNAADKPVFKSGEWKQYILEYESYFNDNLPFRDLLISLQSRIFYYLFHASANDSVIIGKDGWLFYADKTDGDPLACYKGENLYTKEQLEEIAQNLTEIQQELASQGTAFILFIAPNKERIYADRMPDFYGEPAEAYAAKQIVDYLQANTDISVVYPYDEIMEARAELADITFYHKSDTHWNGAGGYIGSRALLQKLGIDLPELTGSGVEISRIKNGYADLAGMIQMSSDLQNKEYDYRIMIKNRNIAADPRKIYMVRDSFGNAMFDYFEHVFDTFHAIHKDHYNYEDFLEQAPDVFILETVERYAGKLASFQLMEDPAWQEQ